MNWAGHYGRTEVFNLGGVWENKTIKRLWLGFRYSTSVTPRIRIGRVWLEEAPQ